MARYAEDAANQTACPRCGGSIDDCGDAEKVWYPQRAICYKTMAQARYNAKYEALHSDLPFHDGTFTRWGKERTADTRFHYTEGVTVWVSDVDYSPDDDFLATAVLDGDPGSLENLK